MNVRGMSFVDVVVGTGIMLVIFISLFAVYQLAIELVLNSKARVGGLSLVSERMEYVRSLPYESLGTVGGIPAGPLPQVATSTINNITYVTRTLIRYIDDPADGTGAADTNAITADSKEIKIETTWTIRNRTRSTFVLTRIAPHGIESLTSGGTLRVNVFNALAEPVSLATVRIANASSSPTIDVTVLTDSTGSVAFPGAPQASNYQITVSKLGHSSAQTYDITSQNPNPNPGHVSVANQQTTTASFGIDTVATLAVTTVSPIDTGAFSDLFSNDSGLSATTSVEVVGGDLVLADPGTGFPFIGDARSDDVAPQKLVSWDQASWSGTTPTDTSLRVHVVFPDAGSYSLVPDGVLPGNSAGFTSGLITLSQLSTSTFPTLALKAVFETTNASSTPTLEDWRLDYHAGPSPLPNIGFSLYGTKTVGTTISGAPIYKVVQSFTTDEQGAWTISALEWDTYTFNLTGSTYDIAELCPSPVSVLPGSSGALTMVLVPNSTNTLRVEVTANNQPLSGATVTLTSPGSETQSSSSCGQAFFDDLTVDTYTLTVTKSGYQDSVQDVSVAGATVVTVPLVP